MENKIGSDLKLFFYNLGFLKNLRSIIKLKKKSLFFVLIHPGVNCSTKEIYAGVKNYSRKKTLEKYRISTKSKFINYLSKSSNDLQSIVEKKYPLIRTLLSNISKQHNCYLARMTGSGSACFGLFLNENSSKVALKKMRKKYPKFWFSIAKTI